MLQKCLMLFCLYCGILGQASAQETPYYQPPEKRTKNHELAVMPNLSSKSISYYIGLTGGFRKAYNSNYSISPFDVNSSSYTTGFWEVNLGQNRNDNIMIETGFSHQKSNLTTTFLNLFRQPVTVTNEQDQNYIPIRLKKRLLTIDRITKTAFINLGVGAAYMVNKPSVYENQTINFATPKTPNPNDLRKLTISRENGSLPILFEAFAEIRGKVSERLEITAFFKTIFKNPKDLQNNFVVESVSGASQEFGFFEKSTSISFGLQARFNSPKFIKYSSNVD